MNNEKKLVSVTVPEDVSLGTLQLTHGKTYPVFDVYENFSFHTKIDNGDTAYCLQEKCAFLNGGNWILNYEE